MSSAQAASQQPLSLSSCTPNHIDLPTLPGLDIFQLSASPVYGVSENFAQGIYTGHGATKIENVSYCNVSLAYSHVGHPDAVNVQVWLPPPEDWNARLMAIGGGGLSAGLNAWSLMNMLGAVNDGYAAISTDAGHDGMNPDPITWALDENGQIDMYSLENFAHRALDDGAKLGKAVAAAFYGSKPKYSYWNGCSQGGRQGLMNAQRYPDAYDGVLAVAPAINWSSLVNAIHWAQFVMNSLQTYPRACELEAIRSAAIETCDLKDGVQDGIISDDSTCNFDPYSMVGHSIECEGTKLEISMGAAHVAHGAWEGPKTTKDKSLWYGFPKDSELTNGAAATLCPPIKEGKCSIGKPFATSEQWIRWFVAESPQVDLTNLAHLEWEELFHKSRKLYSELWDTNDPDLSKFRQAGGKMITFHGLSDQLIPHASMKEYYEKVLAADPHARDFYRYYEAPGVAHCLGGLGGYPEHAFEDLVAWVEEGRAPETLKSFARTDVAGQDFERPLCQYPLVARYDGYSDVAKSSSYHCASEYLGNPSVKSADRTVAHGSENPEPYMPPFHEEL